jgi:tetratricopeptide (TPR) repeat protein
MSDSLNSDVLSVQTEARAAVRAAEQAFHVREQSQLIAALQGCDRALQALPAERTVEGTGAPDPEDALAKERALLWLWRGRLLVMAGKPEVVVQGLQSLDQAIARLHAAGARDGAADALAIAWMNRGSGLFRLESREALAEAVRSYDQAIALLERVEPAANAGARGALGASWMNRGVGLMNLEHVTEEKEATAARLADAAKSLERAILVLESVAPTQRAAQHNLASTWSNLGMLRSRLGDPAGAVEAQRKAVKLFRPIVAESGDAGETYELAARLFNLGQACGAAGDHREALASGREALVHAATVETGDPQALELVLRIRHGLCVVLGGLLAAGRVKPSEDSDRAARLEEAGDLVEDGLAALNARGVSTEGLAVAGARLYEFGAWLYRTQQPQFLGEFLLEHLGRDKGRAQDMDRVLDILQSLGDVEARVKELGAAG